jgi:hypothetical protein
VTHQGAILRVKDADELYRRIIETNDGYGTLQTTHKIDLEIVLSGDRTEKKSFRAVLAINRPRLFRLNILGPMGAKLLDLLYEGGRHTLLYLDQALKKSSRFPEIIDSMVGDLRAIYRLDPLPSNMQRKMRFTQNSSTLDVPLYSLNEYRDDNLIGQMDAFATTLAIARSEGVDQSGNVRKITYRDYETDGKVMIPRTIRLTKEGPIFYWLSIKVESIALDQKQDERLFLAE